MIYLVITDSTNALLVKAGNETECRRKVFEWHGNALDIEEITLVSSLEFPSSGVLEL